MVLKWVLVLVLLVHLSVVLGMSRGVCKNYPCGCCCTNDVIPCCDRNFKTASTVAAAVAVLENEEIDESEEDKFEEEKTLDDVDDEDAFTEAISDAPPPIPDFNLCDRYTCQQSNCTFSCSMNIEKASDNGWLCKCNATNAIVAHQLYLLLDDMKTMQCMNEESLYTVHPLDRQTYITQLLDKCVTEGCTCQKSENYDTIFKQQLDAYNKKLEEFTRTYLAQLTALNQAQQAQQNQDAAMKAESANERNKEYQELIDTLNLLNTKLFNARSQLYASSKAALELETKTIPAAQAEIELYKNKTTTQRFLYDVRLQQYATYQDAVKSGTKLTREQTAHLKLIEEYILTFQSWLTRITTKTKEVKDLKTNLENAKVSVNINQNVVNDVQAQLTKILATTRQEAGAYDCYSYIVRYPDLANAFGNNCEAAWRHWLIYGTVERRDPAYDKVLHDTLASFDCNFYLRTYKSLMTSFTQDCTGATKHYLTAGLKLKLARSDTFDCYSYLGRYEDLRKAFGDDCNAALNHWNTYGTKEGRVATFYDGVHNRWSSFDCYSYLARYSEVRKAVKDNCDAAKTNWQTIGFKKSYDARPDTNLAGKLSNFDCYSYIARYADIRQAFGSDCGAVKNHYYEVGFDVGLIGAFDAQLSRRYAEFDCYSYLGRYIELRKVFKYNCDAAKNHWITNGIKEGRDARLGLENKYMTFDCDSYYARYQDIKKAIPYDCNQLNAHWLNTGIKEGRDCSLDTQLVARFKNFDCNSYFVRYADVRKAFGYKCTLIQKHWSDYGFLEERDGSYDAHLSAIPTTFDCPSYMMRYQDIRKTFKGDCTAAKKHWQDTMIAEARDATPDPQLIQRYNNFDCLSYAARYADLRKAFGLDCNKLRLHYIQYGIDEGRDASANAALSKNYANFDCYSYLARYEDLRSAFGGDCSKLEKHWKEYGIVEGRDGSYDAALRAKFANFDCNSYLGRYPDVLKVFGLNCDKAKNHFYTYGIKEGRDGSFNQGLAAKITSYDCYSYLARYEDLRKAFGNNCDAVKKHWLNFGLSESRNAAFDEKLNNLISKFDCKSYLARYADVKKAFGSNCDKAFDHFLKFGITEGRSY